MFYCDACGAARNWPNNVGGRSYGPCEICKTPTLCMDVPSSQLPDGRQSGPSLNEAPRSKDVVDLARILREVGSMSGGLQAKFAAVIMAKVQTTGSLLALALSALDLHEPDEVKQLLEAMEDDPDLLEYVTGLMSRHPQLYEGECHCVECDPDPEPLHA